jgi:serine/threonine protein kinase
MNGVSQTDGPPPCDTVASAEAAEALIDRLVAEMSASWHNGRRVRAEDLLRPHIWIDGHPLAALRLIHEECCLRQEQGETLAVEEIVRRFPQWREQLQVMLECQRLLGLEPAPPQFPGVGDVLHDFRILAELGRGGRGRVFLARQTSLADRALVLKMTPCEGQEHLSLARLQHTHIAPLYWAQGLPARNLRILCMPFLGVVTLSALQEQLTDVPPAQRSGRDLRDVLERTQAAELIAEPAQGPDRERLSALSYVQAVCWIGNCLAEALDYAHRRGLVHLDLKPSNVLLAADGQPMILDFHLARAPIDPGESSPEQLGGTRDYMSPEQRAALAAVSVGKPVPGRVDGRSDQYSLGLVLHELLGGKRDGDGVPQPHLLSHANPQVSVGLTDVLTRCLAIDPRQRYLDAAALAGDLRRHLEDLPLRGVANRSLRERWAKWRCRRPHELPLVAAVLLSVALLLGGGLLVGGRWVEHRQAAEAALFQGQQQMARRAFSDAVQTFEQGSEQAAGLPGAGRLAAALDAHLLAARRASKAADVHTFTNFMRFHAVLQPMPPRMRLFVDGSKNLWKEREWLLGKGDVILEESIEQSLRADLLDLPLLAAHLRARLVPPQQTHQAHKEALDLLAQAEALFGRSGVLARHQWAHAQALGDAALAQRFEARAQANPPHTSWEHYALGRFWLFHGDLQAAVPELEQAATLEPMGASPVGRDTVAGVPSGFLPHFYLGVCAHRLGDQARALEEFTFCAGRWHRAECYLHRGLAHAAAGNLQRAAEDYKLALQLDSGGGLAAECYHRLALVHLGRKDEAAARRSIRAALESNPHHAGALALRKMLGTGEEPAARGDPP